MGWPREIAKFFWYRFNHINRLILVKEPKSRDYHIFMF